MARVTKHPAERMREWTEEDNSGIVAIWEQEGLSTDMAPRVFNSGLLRAIVGFEPAGGGPPRWHISVSHGSRIPNWEEMVAACHDLRPGVPFNIGVPPASMWLNLHPNVLHAWESRDPFLVQEYAQNAIKGHRST